MNRQMPTFEPFEPRLLMSGTPTLESLFASAELLDITPGMTVSADGQLATSDSAMMYSFTTKATGTISLAMESADGQLDPYLKLYDANHRLLATNDNQGGSLDSLISRYVSAGQTFYVEASGAGVSTGDFSLSLTSNPVDDFSNTMADAKSVYVYASGSATFTGTVNYSSDKDFVQYVAAKTGRATVRLYSVSLNRSVAVFDSEGSAVDVQQSQAGYWLTATFLVTEGESSFIRISDLAGATGYFYAQILPTIAQEFVDATDMDVPGAQQAAESGILAAGESDMYSFTAQATGYFEIDMSAADGSSANPYLQVYNDQQRLYYTNDNAGAGTLDSHIRMYVREGQTFYVRASLAGGTDGAYDISFTGMPTDDLANSAAAAAAMYSSATGAATKYGTVNYRGDVDVMSYSVRESGTVRANLGAYYGTLAGVVSVYNADGNVIASQTAPASGSVDLQFSAVAGEQYFFRVEGADSSTGRYVLKVLPTIWQEFVDASAMNVPSASQRTVDGTLSAGERDTYKITVPATGYYVLDMKAADGSSVDSYLEVYNENQVRVAYNDNAAYGTGDSRVRIYVREGQVLYVRASAAKGSVGDYALTFESQPFDDAGNDAARAAALYVSPNGSFLKYGNIQYSDDVDCFAYTAKYSGLVQTTVATYGYRSQLAPSLTVRDAEGNEVGSVQAGAGGTLSLSFSAIEGQTYYFSVSGDGNGLGMYNVKVLPTVWQEFLDATEVDVAGAASENVTGTLGADGKATYKVTVPASGYFQFNMRAADGSSVDSYLEVYNENQVRVAYNDNAGAGQTDSQVRLYVREGQVLYVRASAAKGTEGDFALTLESQPFDDAGNDAARAAALYVSPSGAFLKYGNIQYGNDVDCFSYTAKYSGLVQTTVATYGYRSQLAPSLTVRDAEGNEVGSVQAGAGGSLALSFSAVQSQTYFFSVSGDGNGLGTYNVKVLPTVWQEFLDATDVDVAGAATETVGGTLGTGGIPEGNLGASGTLGVDGKATYKVTVPASGYMQVNMSAAEGSSINSYLEVYNEAQQRVAYNDNAAYGTGDSQVRIYVREGQVLYVRASAAGGTEGDYTLTFESQPFDDVGNDAARAAAMYVAANGSATKYGNVQYSNDTDCFAYTAKHSGLVQTTVAATGYRSSLEAVLTVRDVDGNAVGTAQAGVGGSLNLNFSAVEGQTYFFSVSGADSSQGTYSMKILPTVWQDFIDATNVNVPGGESQTAGGTLLAGGRATYSFTVPASGYFEINMRAADGSGLDSYLEVYNSSQTRVSYSDNAVAGSTDSRVRIYVTAGQTYYVRASSAKGTEGDFSLSFESQPFDDAGNDAARAAAMYVAANGSSTKYGNIQYSNDTDCFAYTAKAGGLVQTTVSRYRSTVSAVLTVRDAEGNVMGTAQADESGTLNLNFTAIQGQKYFFSVSGADSSLGMYSLKVQPTVWQDFIDATDVTVAAAGQQTASGTLGAGQYKTYIVTAPAGGYMQFDMSASQGSSIDSYIEVYTENQRRLTYNDNVSYSSKDSRIRLAVTEGQQFFVRVSGTKGTAGDFAVTFTSQPTDDCGNDLATAKAMAMAASGSSSAVATINYGSDVDVFKFNAAVTGDMTVLMAKYGSSDLIGAVSAMDVSGTQLSSDDASDGTAGITFHVVAGETYYLSASSLEQTAGRYVLTVATQADPTPDPTPDPEPEPEPAPPAGPTPGASVAATVQQSGGTTRLIVTGTNGNDVITLSYNGSATSLASGAGTQTFAGYYGYISVYGFGGDDVIRLDYSIMGETLVYAGDGNDKVYNNSQGAATIYGEAGDDLIVSVGTGVDTIYGGSGYDSYWVDSTDILVGVSAAETAGKAVHKIASFYQPWTTNPASADYVSKVINGQNLRDPASGSAYTNQAHRPLFVDGPEYNDIRQGALGDCYYLAVLASLSDTDPDLIRQAITDLGDGTYAVRFYRGGAEVYLRLDADLPSAYAKLTPDGETWVMLMEKAYAFFRYGQNSYSSIEGGWMSTVVTELTNASTQTLWTGGSASSLANNISNSLAAGHSVTLGSYSNSASPIVGSHAYMVKSIEGAGADAYVTVYNPWGVDGRSYDSNYNDGLLRLSMAQIQACFSAVVLAMV